MKPEPHNLFVPFIAENTGRLSGRAEKFIFGKLSKLDKMDLEASENIKWERLKFLEEVNIRLARTNAEVMSSGRALGHVRGYYY